ncbi:DMT family transporter [Niallia sp. 01092]|uniref:DMT family transporter n=1 Tax=unclassified Niallia TaxID=2837522 RepID=UPI003FCFBFEE
MHWLFLCLAILFEVAGTVTMKLSYGFTKILPSILFIIFYLAAFGFLTLTLKSMDISIAYAIWSGLGIVLLSVIGFYFFQENLNPLKVFSIVLIIVGVILLNLSSNHGSSKQLDEKQAYSKSNY